MNAQRPFGVTMRGEGSRVERGLARGGGRISVKWLARDGGGGVYTFLSAVVMTMPAVVHAAAWKAAYEPTGRDE